MRVKRNRGDGWLGVLIALVELIIAGARYLFVKARELGNKEQMKNAQQPATTDATTDSAE